MTISREAISRLRSHWAIEALGADRVNAAHDAAASMYVDSNLGRQLHREGTHDAATEALIQDVAFAYEIVASEGIESLAQVSLNSGASDAAVAEAAAHEAFALLRALPL